MLLEAMLIVFVDAERSGVNEQNPARDPELEPLAGTSLFTRLAVYEQAARIGMNNTTKNL